MKLYTSEETEAGAAKQVEQIKEAIQQGYNTLVITPIDYEKINESGILEENQNCNIICYDRMIINNSAIDFYVSCDPSKIGEMQAQFLLEKIGDEEMNIELLAGPSTDKNAVTYFESANNLLKKNALLNVPSGKKTYNEVKLAHWSGEDAKAAMISRLSETLVLPDLILAPNDVVANGVIEAIETLYPEIQNYPVITGQDKTDQAVANIKAGKQAMTIYKEYEDMAESASMVVNSFISGKPVFTTNYFDNGKIKVPTKYTNFTLVTIHNVDK